MHYNAIIEIGMSMQVNQQIFKDDCNKYLALAHSIILASIHKPFFYSGKSIISGGFVNNPNSGWECYGRQLVY